MNGNEFNYVTELQSSGSEDDLSIYSLGSFTILFFFISIFFKRKNRVLAFYLLFAYFSLFLIQMGEIDVTILNGNFILLIMVVINLLLTFYFWLILFRKIKNYLNQEV
mgnify:FL=1